MSHFDHFQLRSFQWELFLIQVDFGLSRDNFPGGVDIVTATKCGTKEYMAPEVYRKEPYGLSADWWSFGAVSFDLMTNKVPILEQDYEKSIEFPSSMSRLAKDLLKRFVIKHIWLDQNVLSSTVAYLSQSVATITRLPAVWQDLAIFHTTLAKF